MSIGTNTPRLLAAAKEFNIGKDTLVEFLQSKDFDIEASKPNTKLTPEMYNALQSEFAQDKAVKRKSDEIELPKTGMMEAAKRKEAAAVPDRFKKEEITDTKPPVETKVEEEAAPPKAEPAPKLELKIELPKEIVEEKEIVKEKKVEAPKAKEETVVEDTPAKEEVKAVSEEVVPIVDTPKVEVETKAKVEEKKTPATESVPQPTAKKEEVKKEEPKKKEVVKTETKEEAVPEQKLELKKQEELKIEEPEVEHIETVAPKLEGPKILDKIDLSNLNLSTRPKKGVGKKIEEKKKAEVSKERKPIEKKDIAPSSPRISMVKPATPIIPLTPPKAPASPEQEEVVREHIEMRAPKLEGPKVIGKIELPLNTISGKQERKEKRKRKRIPVDIKKPNQRPGAAGTPGTPATPGAGGVGRPASGVGRPDNRPGGRPQRPRPAGAGGPNDRRRPAAGRTATGTPQEIDAKEIQEKIRETQAKLAGGGSRNRNLKAKYRRNKREEMAEKRAAEEDSMDGKTIQVTEFISVSELASLLDVSFADIISKCMNLGIMVSINQRLDAEVIELVASEFDTDVEFIDLDEGIGEEEEDIEEDEANLVARAPVVTIMGHVDHGKTSLLDYIRSATVVAGEAGGITQHIGAYRVTTESGKNLTFLDTPGHEAFTAMRARGAKAADVAVIVIAADDAIMPQTKEAISHAQAAGLPMVFAINKIDKESSNPEKIKEQLSAMNILVEDWGGKFQSQEISAKKGMNINKLLDKILLEAELLDLKSNPNREAVGLTIEASLDKGRGYVTTVLVQSGKLRTGDMIVAGQYFGKVKAMNNERGHKVNEAGPSTPVQVLGLNGAPQAGEKFKVYNEESDAKSVANHRAQIMREQGLRTRKHITLDEIGRRLALGNFKELNVIIKADFDGSAEALSDSLQKLSTEEIVVNVVLKGVGQITETDVMLASASDAIILGFQVRPSIQASKVADNENIEIRHYSIIYDAIAEIKSAMEGMLEPKFEKKIVGNIEIREVFKISGVGSIAGCYVLDGKFLRSTKINIIREGIVVHTGELASLKRFKDDVKEVSAGYECGLSIKNFNDIRAEDVIEGYEEVEIKRKL